MGIINNQNELTMSAAALLRQAEELKASVAETSKGSSEAWVKRQQLQDLYQRLLVSDLEYALDKKLEQDLWNYVFKNQITTFQSQVRDKTNPKRGEIQASLNLFLETASGFYLQLLQELCNAFDLDLPFRKNPASIGILQEYGPTVNKVKQPGKTSSHYVCQHCLVHLGDIARYRQQIDQAQTYYRHAANLVPYNGQPYNQLAILEAAKGSKLSTVFFYLRSVAVKHPFPVAATNLEKLYAKLARDSQHGAGSGVKGSKLTMNELVTVFLQFHALVHQSSDLSRAKTLSGKLVVNLTAHLTSLSFTSRQLVHMVAINLFALHHAKSLPTHKDNTKDSGGGDDKGDSSSEMSRDEQEGYDLVFNLMLHFFDLMLQCTPRQETKAREYHTLPAIKVILDWFHTDRDILAHPAFKSFTIIWPNLARALNTLQFSTNIKVAEIEKYRTIPLPEDQDLQCFLPIEKAHRYLEMERAPAEGLPDEIEQQLRCHRLLQHGLWICDEFPSLNRLNVQKLRTGRLQFTAPTPHVKVLQSNSGSTGGGAEETGQVRTATVRQNVAIQAIMQNKNKATAATSTDSATATTPVQHTKEDGGSTGKSSSLSRSNSLSSAETRPTQTAAAATTKAQASSTKAHTHDAGMMTQAIPLQPGGRRLQRHFEGVRTSDAPPPVLPTPHHRHHHPGAERFPMGIPPSLDPPQPRITTQPPIQMTVRPPMDSQINQIRQPFSHPQQPPPPPESAFDALQKLQQQNEALLKLQKLYQQNEHAAANNFPGHGFQNFPGEPPVRNESPGDLLAAHLTPKLRAAIGLPPHPQHQQHQQPQHQPQHQPQQQMDPIQRLLHNAAQQQQQQQQHHQQQQQQQHLNLNQPFTTASFTPSPIAQPLSSQPQKPPSPGSLTVEQLFTLVTQQQQHDKAPLPPYPPNLQLNLPPEPATSPATFLFGNKGSQQSPAVSSLFGQQSRSPGLMSPGGEPFAGGENHPTNPSIGAPHKRHSDGGRKNTPSPLSLSSNLDNGDSLQIPFPWLSAGQEAPKHDSPPSGANLLASLFGRSDTLRPEIVQNELENGGNQYSLFGDSGWNYDSFMPKKDAAGSSIGSSPGSSSIRSTPDPTNDEGRYEGRQNFWSSGPSPLERLLEQQKQQRQQSEPH